MNAASVARAGPWGERLIPAPRLRRGEFVATVPGQHHARMSMYLAQAQGGKFEIVENLGIIDPKERMLTDV
jgi:hypothetical protein